MGRNRERWLGSALVFFGLFVASDARAQAEDAGRTEEGVVIVDTTKGRDLDETQTVRVRVKNTIVPAQSVIVSVDHSIRPEYVLGVVRPNETREFIVDTRRFTGGFRVIATSGTGPFGRTLVNSVRPVSFTRAHWNLGVNLMRIERVTER